MNLHSFPPTYLPARARISYVPTDMAAFYDPLRWSGKCVKSAYGKYYQCEQGRVGEYRGGGEDGW